MREIKFRAWWKHPEYFPEGSMFVVGGLIFATPQEGEPEYDDCSTPKQVGLMESANNSKIGWNDAKHCTLMQYTGLKDKNGKEIYEGDIATYGIDLPEPIIFKDGAFRWGRGSDYVINTKIPNILEVIGNIYENPELLK